MFLVLTFIGVVVATLAECQPFNHYWQVVPEPKPQCRQGYGHLLTMGVTDIITDILLVFFPIPIILRSGMPIKRKLSLIALFSMSIILIGITGARVPLVIEKRGLQQYRTVFASSEILAAGIVANAIILGSFLRDRGIKKAKYKHSSTTDSMERRSSSRRHTLQRFGSDEDLARSLGYRTNPDFAEQKTTVARPAQAVDLNFLSPHGSSTPFQNNNWQFPGRQSGISQYSGESEQKDRSSEDPMPSPRAFGRRVSFFDVGGLLEGGHATASPSPTDSVLAQDFAPQGRRASRASSSLTPNGRAYPPPARRSSRYSQSSEDYETTARPGHQSLQDAGGLLSESDELAIEDGPSSTSFPVTGSQTAYPQPREPSTLQTVRSTTETNRPNVPTLQDAGGLLSPS